MGKVHFVGVAGAGMSALAQFHAMRGGRATGSDRTFDQGGAGELAAKLKALGVALYPQDASALEEKPDEVVYSTAVEESIPDLRRAKELGIPFFARADLLARHVAEHKTVAVAGTSGKSTVVAMIYEILDAAGKSPSVITGGALLSLERKGFVGNAFAGKSDLLVVEADESDGTLVRYQPWLGLLLNVSKDHKEVAELNALFETFLSRCAERQIADGGLEAHDLRLDAKGSSFTISGVEFRLPLPGRHNVENALAAVAACQKAGATLEVAARSLAGYQGVARRFQSLGQTRGVEVIDDFAHNPAKVAATLAAAHLRAPRVHAIFQLHGFAPARFMRQEFIDAFAAGLRPDDTLWMPEIYYAGGTASKTISAGEIVDAIRARGRRAEFVPAREEILPAISRAAAAGDLILVMGARDPSLPRFAEAVLAELQKTSQAA